MFVFKIVFFAPPVRLSVQFIPVMDWRNAQLLSLLGNGWGEQRREREQNIAWTCSFSCRSDLWRCYL